MKLSDEVIEALKENPQFQVFQEYIVDKISELSDIQEFRSYKNNKLAGEEIRIRSHVVMKLFDIFAPVVKFNKTKTITDEQLKERAKDFGL